jgi:hypothetical protein
MDLQEVGSWECGNELLGSIKCREFLDWLRTCLASQGLWSIELVIWLQKLFVMYHFIFILQEFMEWNRVNKNPKVSTQQNTSQGLPQLSHITHGFDTGWHINRRGVPTQYII